MENVMQTFDLTKRFKDKIAVDKVNMTIKKGDIYGFIGKNGAGKTTLMRMILSIAKPTSGSFELFDGMNKSRAGKKIGSLIEYPAIYTECTATENMKRFGIFTNSSEKEINEILDFVGLSDVGNKKAGKFSLGMKQRLGIAIAMLGNPEFMVLDEPVNGLDPAGMKEVRELIVKLNKEKNITFLISSHLLEELSKTVTKYGIIKDGALVEEISCEELEKKCTNKMSFVVDDINRALPIIQGYDNSAYVEDNKVVINSCFDKSGLINKELVNSDVLVNQIQLDSVSLEDYFVKRIGG